MESAWTACEDSVEEISSVSPATSGRGRADAVNRLAAHNSRAIRCRLRIGTWAEPKSETLLAVNGLTNVRSYASDYEEFHRSMAYGDRVEYMECLTTLDELFMAGYPG